MSSQSNASYSFIQLDIDHQVASLWLNRPDIRNAFHEDMIAEITAALGHLAQDDDVRVLILRGKGPSFCAGGDLNWMQRVAFYTHDENTSDARQLSKLMHRLYTFPKPTIVISHGHVFGGGMGLVACCDIAISEPNTQFCLSEVKIGLAPSVICPYVMAALGPRLSRRLFLTAEIFHSDQAKIWGFIHDVVAHEHMDATLKNITQHLKAGGPQAQAASKKLMLDIQGQPFTETIQEKTVQIISTLRSSDEGQEGIRSFLEKRKPRWHP